MATGRIKSKIILWLVDLLSLTFMIKRFLPLYCSQFLKQITTEEIINNDQALAEDTVSKYICLLNKANKTPKNKIKDACSIVI